MKRNGPQHPKVFDFAARLAVPHAQAVGMLELLFHYTATFAKAGDIGRYTNQAIGRACYWQGDPDALVEALTRSRWLDASAEHRLLVHDWPEHCEDSVHMSLARAHQHFADGTVPNYRRLARHEREEAEAFYKRAQNATETARDMHTPNARGVCTEQAHAENALPCLSPPLPSHAMPCPSSGETATAPAPPATPRAPEPPLAPGEPETMDGSPADPSDPVAKLAEATGLSVNLNPKGWAEMRALVAIDGVAAAERAIRQAFRVPVGGIGAVRYATAILRGQKERAAMPPRESDRRRLQREAVEEAKRRLRTGVTA